jgi:hypothetical protein
VRGTRESTLFKRGASIRAAISIYDIAHSLDGGTWDSFVRSSLLALPNRVELSEEGVELGFQKAIEQLADQTKKKSRTT